MNTFNVVIHCIWTLACFPPPDYGHPCSCCWPPDPHHVPSPQPSLCLSSPTWFLILWQWLVFRNQLLIKAFSPAHLEPEVLFPSFLSKTTRGLFSPDDGVGGWLWQIDWSVSLPLGGPPSASCQFLSEGLKSAGLS